MAHTSFETSSVRPLFSVVIPALDAGDTLPACLDALGRCEEKQAEIILVDDGSTDETAAVAARYPVRLLRNPRPLGAARARNRGAEQARGEFLVFLDADVTVRPDLFERLRDFFLSHPEATAVSGHYAERPPVKGFFSRYKNLYLVYSFAWMSGATGVINSSLAALRKEAFHRAGGFDPRWRSAEDTIFGWEMARAGHRLFIDRDLRMDHLKEYGLVGLLRNDFTKSYWMARYLWSRRTGLIAFLGGPHRFRHPPEHMAKVPLSCGVLLFLLLFMAYPSLWSLACLTMAMGALTALSLPLWTWLRKAAGMPFMLAAIPLQFLEMMVAGAAIAAAGLVLLRPGAPSAPQPGDTEQGT